MLSFVSYAYTPQQGAMAKKGSTSITSTLFWIGALLVVGNLVLTGFTNKLQFGKIKIKPKGVTFDFGVILDIIMPITNRNAQSVTVRDFVGELWYGPVRIAVLDQRIPIALLAGSTTNYVIEASIDVDNLADDVKAQLKNGNFLQNFFLKGKMTVGSITVPINEMLTILF